MRRIFGLPMVFFAPDGTQGGPGERKGGATLVPGDYKGMESRSAIFFKRDAGEAEPPAGEDFTNTPFPVVVASENPSIVWDWERWAVIREVLCMDGTQIPANNQIPLLDRHSCYGAVRESIKGSCRNLKVDGARLMGDVYFSSLAMDECTLVREGHLTDTSVGYNVDSSATLILKPGESGTINGRSFTNNFNDGLDLFVRGKWTPREESLVPIGADDVSKFREDSSVMEKRIGEIIDQKVELELNKRIIIKNSEENRIMETVVKTPEEVRAEERARVADIKSYGERFAAKIANVRELVDKAVAEGTEVNAFRETIINGLDKSAAIETPASELGLSAKEMQRYSISRAISNLAETTPNVKSFEMEVSAEIEKRSGVARKSDRSFFIPAEIQKRLNPDLNARSVLSTTSALLGQSLVPQDYMGGSFIDYLRNKTVLGKLGITVLSGLRGDIVIPKQLSTTVFEMVGYGAPGASNMTFGQVTGTPHYGAVTTEYHRSLILQGNPSIDALITNDLYGAAMVGIDRLGIYGDGGAVEPKGFTNETGVGTVDFEGSPSWTKIVEAGTKLEVANADQLGDPKCLISPKLKGIFKTTPLVGAYPVFIMGADGKIDNRQTEVSNQVTEDFFAEGIWSDLLLLDWNLYELLVNPYGTNSKAGNIETTLFAAFDYVTKRAASFVMRSDS